MAISRLAFERNQFKRKAHKRGDHPVYKLLASHPDQAFTVHEIHSRIKMPEDTIRSMLRNLMMDKVVVHKTPYWAIAHRKRK